MSKELTDYKEKMFSILMSEDHQGGFLQLINRLHNSKRSKKDIYEMFLDFLREIQVDSRTKNDKEVYDRLSDFIDGFTSWGKGFRILPDEPDL